MEAPNAATYALSEFAGRGLYMAGKHQNRRRPQSPKAGFEAFQIPDGDYENQPITKVPRDYLHWWLAHGPHDDPGLRFAIEAYLNLTRTPAAKRRSRRLRQALNQATRST